MFGRGALVAKLGQRVVDEWMIHEVDRHDPRLYNFSPMRARSVVVAAIVLTAAALTAAPRLPASPSAGQTRRTVSLIVTGGVVITENAARQVLAPGAVAID